MVCKACMKPLGSTAESKSPPKNVRSDARSVAFAFALRLNLHCMCMRKGQAKILIESISIETICEQNSARQPLHKLPSVLAAHV